METPPENTKGREKHTRESPLPAERPEVSELLLEIAMEDMVDMEEYEYV
jgi:hypothetical protein